jgi:hypothetical protein
MCALVPNVAFPSMCRMFAVGISIQRTSHGWLSYLGCMCSSSHDL